MTSSQTSSRAAVPAQLDFHTLSIPEALAAEEVDQQRGLSTAEAEERRRVRPEQVRRGEQEPRWRAFLRQYGDPMQIVLLVAGIGSLYPLKQLGTGLVLLLLTLFNAVLGLQPGGQGGGGGRGAAEDDDRQGARAPRRRARRSCRPSSSCPATSSRSRPATSSRPTAGCCARRRSRSPSRR